MVSTLSMVFMAFSMLVSMLLPVVLGVVLYRKTRFSIRALFVGVLIFLVFQVFTRIPGLQMLSQTAWYQEMGKNLWLVALFLSLTAGIFEEIGRWIGFRYLVKKQWQTKNGIAYGIGHGGIEAILLSGFAMVNNLVFSSMINNGTFDQIANQVGPSAAETLRQSLITTAPYMFAFSGIERVMAIILHIALSLLVLDAVRKARPLYLLYAILLHGLANFVAVMAAQLPNGVLVAMIWLVAVAAASIFYIRKMWSSPEQEIPAVAQPAA